MTGDLVFQSTSCTYIAYSLYLLLMDILWTFYRASNFKLHIRRL